MADPEWVERAAAAHCKYSVPGMDAVAVRRSLTFLTRDGERSRFDLYGAAPDRGVVLLIHGGPIPGNLVTTPADWGLFQSLARLLAASGVAAVVVNHRFFSPELAETAINDIEDVFRHVSTLSVDASRVALWVFSGGGSLLGRFLRSTPESVRCIVAYYAALHAQTAEYSAATAVAGNVGRIPPMLVARAGLDTPQLNVAIDHFIAVALRKNAPLEVMNHPDGQHGFDFRDDNERTREILARTVDFFRTHLIVRGPA